MTTPSGPCRLRERGHAPEGRRQGPARRHNPLRSGLPSPGPSPWADLGARPRGPTSGADPLARARSRAAASPPGSIFARQYLRPAATSPGSISTRPIRLPSGDRRPARRRCDRRDMWGRRSRATRRFHSDRRMRPVSRPRAARRRRRGARLATPKSLVRMLPLTSFDHITICGTGRNHGHLRRAGDGARTVMSGRAPEGSERGVRTPT